MEPFKLYVIDTISQNDVDFYFNNTSITPYISLYLHRDLQDENGDDRVYFDRPALVARLAQYKAIVQIVPCIVYKGDKKSKGVIIASFKEKSEIARHTAGGFRCLAIKPHDFEDAYSYVTNQDYAV